jgi:hypothetical protein
MSREVATIDEGHEQQRELDKLHLSDLWKNCGQLGLKSLQQLGDSLNTFGLTVVTLVICSLLQLSYFIGLLRAEGNKDPQRNTPVYFIAFWILVVLVITISVWAWMGRL